MTIGEKYGIAMTLKTQEDADAYFEQLVADSVNRGMDRRDAESLERGNLAYYAGYFDSETRGRVERLFNCSHPVFGPIADNGQPTKEQAFEARQRAYRGK